MQETNAYLSLEEMSAKTIYISVFLKQETLLIREIITKKNIKDKEPLEKQNKKTEREKQLFLRRPIP